MIKRCPKCNGTALKLFYNLPDQQGSAYWTCLQCSWEKFIPWWNRKKYIRLEKKLERVNEILDLATYLTRKADPVVKEVDEKNG